MYFTDPARGDDRDRDERVRAVRIGATFFCVLCEDTDGDQCYDLQYDIDRDWHRIHDHSEGYEHPYCAECGKDL